MPHSYTQVQRVCSWCKGTIGFVECNIYIANEPKITHGICKECLVKHFPKKDDDIEEYIIIKSSGLLFQS